MSISTIKGNRVDIHAWVPAHEIESSAIDQLRNVAALPWVAHHVAVMPDVHAGKGCTVGSVIAMEGACSPAAVGVDIGCGMGAIKTSLKASDLKDLKQLRSTIESIIPVGFNSHAKAAYNNLTNDVESHQLKLKCVEHFSKFKDLTAKVKALEGKAMTQLGSLGGGNHFIEVCIGEEICEDCKGAGHWSGIACTSCFGNGRIDPSVYLMLHSGSRNIGKELAEFHIEVAKELDHNQALADKDLAVFLSGTRPMEAYRHDLYWAQEYALLNRKVMFKLLKVAMQKHYPDIKFNQGIYCHHNYLAEEVHFGENLFVTRKGAIRAGVGDFGIIPGSMGTKSYIVQGLGNTESFFSASHGAGRTMSRGAAKRKFTLKDLEEQTAGVECRKDEGVLDEIPGCYKDIDQVMENQKDLVEIKAVLKQVLTVKG